MCSASGEDSRANARMRKRRSTIDRIEGLVRGVKRRTGPVAIAIKPATRQIQMKTFRVTLQGATPYSQSKFHEAPKLDKEGPDDYDKRTVLEHLHYDPITEEVFIPPMAIKNCLADTAKFLSMQIP